MFEGIAHMLSSVAALPTGVLLLLAQAQADEPGHTYRHHHFENDSLTWILGNTSALAAWWVISGVFTGVLLLVLEGTISYSYSAHPQEKQRLQRRFGRVVGGLIGLSGGMTVGTISQYSGLIGLIYLWGLVGMVLSSFIRGASFDIARWQADLMMDRTNDPRISESRSSVFLDQLSNPFSRRSSDEGALFGALGGAALGGLYGFLTGLILPLSAVSSSDEDSAFSTSFGAAIIWAILGGFAGIIAVIRHGLDRGMITLGVGLLVGSSAGAFISFMGLLFGDMLSGAINGMVGGVFFGAIAAEEMINRRFI